MLIIKRIILLLILQMFFVTIICVAKNSQLERQYKGSEFHGFLINAKTPLEGVKGSIVQSLSARLQSLSWELTLIDHENEGYFYELQYDPSSYKWAKSLSFGRGWDMAYNVEKLEEVKWSEPIFVPVIKTATTYQKSQEKAVGEDKIPGADGFQGKSCSWLEKDRSRYKLKGKAFCFPKSSDPFDWADKRFLHFSKARDVFGVRGEGVLIGHPDTGYWPHLEIIDNISLEYSYNFVDDNTNAKDSLKGFIYGHGVMTSSFIISPPGRQDYRPYSPRHISVYSSQVKNAPYAEGVAPMAKLISYKVLEGTVVFSKYNTIIRAIRSAVSDGAGVVSISLGGLHPSSRLRAAVEKADREGVIIVAAAGNYLNKIGAQGFVVWPARYPTVIAVGASDSDARFWRHSSKGKHIDISAPGAGTWGAHIFKGKDSDGNKQVYSVVRRTAGTSPATAYVAGAAALFLSYHGQDRLKKMYGKEKIATLFRYMLKHYAYTRPAGWNVNKYGSGILNVYRLLAAPLPDPKTLASKKKKSMALSPAYRLGTLFPDFKGNWLKKSLTSLEKSLERELTFYLSLYTLTMPPSPERASFRKFLRRHRPSHRLKTLLNP